MRFLNTQQTKAEIKKLILTSQTADLAVAFWGKGSLNELGISHRTMPLRIICNLALGGTNPQVIDDLKLVQCTPVVRQNNSLHAKVYLFDNASVIGSSNASANGLALEGSELTHWDEANVLITDKKVLKDIRKWMDNLEQLPITDADLVSARSKWASRRRIAPLVGKTVLKMLHNDHKMFNDRKAYLAIYYDDLSNKAKNFENKLRKQTYHTNAVEIFEDWPELPKDGIFLCFRATNRSFRFDGIVRRKPEFRDYRLDKNTTTQIAWKERDVFGLTLKKNDKQEMKEWRVICKMTADNFVPAGDRIFVPLFKVGELLNSSCP